MTATATVRPRPDRRNTASRAQLLDRIRAEFHEMPCLRLTAPQARRLFGLRADVCERVFGTLIAEGTLTCGADGRYGVPAEVAWRGRMSRVTKRQQSSSLAS
jgi:hypothetical protein